MVSSLIDKDTKWWKPDLIKSLFLPFEADTIFRIPISYSLLEDILIRMGKKVDLLLLRVPITLLQRWLNNVSSGKAHLVAQTHHFGRKSGSSKSHQRLKFFLGVPTWMDFPPCTISAAEDWTLLGFVLYVIKVWNPLRTPFFVVIMQDKLGPCGKTARWTL